MPPESTPAPTPRPWFSLRSFGAGILVMLAILTVAGLLNQNNVRNKTQLSHVYFDTTTGKLVTDSIVNDSYYSKSFLDTRIQTPTKNQQVIMSVPEETVIFHQKASEDGRVVYGSLLTLASYFWKLPSGFATPSGIGSGQSSHTSLVFGYDTVSKSIVFAQIVPDYNTIYAISPGGELIAIASHGCYGCDGGPSKYIIIDATGKVREPKDLGVQYKVEFTGPRSYKTTAGTSEGCDAMGCFNPTEVSGEQQL